jgi:hypothetical protein
MTDGPKLAGWGEAVEDLADLREHAGDEVLERVRS